MKERYAFTLYKIAILGGCWKPIFISTKDLGDQLGISQQSASRRLKELERMGLIIRDVSKKGQFIKITDKGIDILRDLYSNLKRVFAEAPKSFLIRGYVFSGFSEGSYYMSIPYYYEQFVSKLGFKPYLGTLNLKLKSFHDIEIRKLLEFLPGIKIEGFSNEKRTYGGAKCFRAKIKNIDGAVLIIERTHYGKDVIELISPIKIRDALNLKDGDEVEVEVFLES